MILQRYAPFIPKKSCLERYKGKAPLDETELYAHVIDMYGKEKIRADLEKFHDEHKKYGVEVQLDTRIDIIKGVKIVAIGETHGSLLPITHTHENVVQEIAKNPESWMFLIEGLAEEISTMTAKKDDVELFLYLCLHGYYIELAKLFQIPCLEALCGIYEEQTKERIAQQGGFPKDTIDTVLIKLILGYYDEEDVQILGRFLFNREMHHAKRVKEILSDISEELGLSIGKIGALLLQSRLRRNQKLPEPSFNDLVPHWNRISRLRLEEVFDAHPTKTNVLLIVGGDHLPMLD